MKILALIAAATMTFAVQPASADTNVRANVNIGAPDTVNPTTRQRCPAGTTPAGAAGCKGKTITDPATLRTFNSPIRAGCVQGAKRIEWIEGVDPQGRPVKYRVEMHAECGKR